VLGLDDLAADARFASNAARVENRTELIPLLAERLRERPAEDWVPALDGAGVPVGKVRTVPEALAAAAAAGRAATITVDHPSAGPLELVASPIWGPTASAPSAPPLLGEHTREVLLELGRPASEIEALAERGVVRLAPRG
jgi:crotonobetainyl-CoA:carnitine CoA-transferase CaiB-like acyl-CoA transferase